MQIVALAARALVLVVVAEIAWAIVHQSVGLTVQPLVLEDARDIVVAVVALVQEDVVVAVMVVVDVVMGA